MAGRKRLAKREEVAKVLDAFYQQFWDAMFSPRAPHAIREIIASRQEECRSWRRILRELKKSTANKRVLREQKLNEMRRLERKHGPGFVFTDMKLEFSIGLLLQKRKLTVNELNLVSHYLRDIARAIAAGGKPPQSQSQQAGGLFKMFERLTRIPKDRVQRFRPEFEEAFYLQEKAKERGERIAATDLARKLTKYEFRRSETSAFRGMQRGIGRVRAEHQRLIQLGIKSPFLAPRTAESRSEHS